MIPKETIDKIFEAARIEEVVGGFVQLKKRGANWFFRRSIRSKKNK